MPLKGSVSERISELVRDNKKKGKEKGANGKKRSMKQILAIALEKKRREK